MRHLIKLTLLADLGSCIVLLIVTTITDDLGMGLYTSIYGFGNILLPTLGVVLIYKLIKRKTTLPHITETIVLQAALLTLLFSVGIIIWAAGEAALFYTLTWVDTKAVYDREFSGFLPVIFSEAILIPTIDRWLLRNKAS